MAHRKTKTNECFLPSLARLNRHIRRFTGSIILQFVSCPPLAPTPIGFALNLSLYSAPSLFTLYAALCVCIRVYVYVYVCICAASGTGDHSCVRLYRLLVCRCDRFVLHLHSLPLFVILWHGCWLCRLQVFWFWWMACVCATSVDIRWFIAVIQNTVITVNVCWASHRGLAH